jgi:transposase
VTGPPRPVRALRVARAGAVKVRTQAGNQLRDLILTAPEPLRQQLAGLPSGRHVEVAARFRPGDPACPAEGTKAAMASLARRCQQLTADITRLDAMLGELVRHAAPDGFLAKRGVATQVAATLLVTTGTTPAGSGRRPASPRCAAPARSMPPPASRSATGPAAVATGRPTPRCGRSP